MTDDLEPVMLSALQHYLFCPRQCALIHVEGAWAENHLTAAGRVLHEKVDQGGGETRRTVHTAASLRLVSSRLGLTGVADQVEFLRVETEIDGEGRRQAAQLQGREGWWRPVPVEYKHGKPKEHRADEVQLCGQALCLEEMLNVSIPSGFLFYGETRRRVEIAFDADLRTLTELTISRVRDLLVSGRTPPPIFTRGCKSCSLVETCRPESLTSTRSARAWLTRQIEEVVDAK